MGDFTVTISGWEELTAPGNGTPPREAFGLRQKANRRKIPGSHLVNARGF
jgi:hypothetical protein